MCVKVATISLAQKIFFVFSYIQAENNVLGLRKKMVFVPNGYVNKKQKHTSRAHSIPCLIARCSQRLTVCISFIRIEQLQPSNRD